MERTRVELTYRNSKRNAKDGTISCKIYGDVAERIRRYCRLKDLSKTNFIIWCVEEKLKDLEPELAKEFLMEKTKDELIQMLLQGRSQL